MPHNVEIKAGVRNPEQFVVLAEQISDTPAEIIFQEDIFYRIEKGRLKLRIFSQNAGELIYYERPDNRGPKTSHYFISKTDDPTQLNQTLKHALGIRGIVRKKRTLFLSGQTRIHFDEVEGLGIYMELEVVLKEGQPFEDGERIAGDLMKDLQIDEADLIEGAYIDLVKSA